MLNEHSSNTTTTNSSNNVWSLGSYNEFAIFILPIYAHLVRLSNISSGDRVLDVACGTGNTTITARRMVPGIKVIGIDFTAELLAQAKEQTSISDVSDIEWSEANLEDLSFEDEILDVVLSIFIYLWTNVCLFTSTNSSKGDAASYKARWSYCIFNMASEIGKWKTI